MSIRKAIKIVGVGVGCITLVVAVLLYCPGPISGAWTGAMFLRLCDAHNFVVINDGECVVYFDDESNSHPERTFCEKTGINTWTWRVTELLPLENSEVGICTNDYIIIPHLLHANVFVVSDGSKTILFRDFRTKDMVRVRTNSPEPQEIDFFRSQIEFARKQKKESASEKNKRAKGVRPIFSSFGTKTRDR